MMHLLVELDQLRAGLAQSSTQLLELLGTEVGFAQAPTQPPSTLSHAVDFP
jgi:hypothetical protein